jgi:hypothetical protein
MFALLSAIAFAMSVQGGRWWSIGDVEVGPFGGRQCFGNACRPTNLAWMGEHERWMRTGMATWAAGLIALAVLVVIAGAIAARRTPRLAAKMALVAIATAAIVGGLFFFQFPGAQFPNAEVDRGVGLFVVAIVLGIAAVIPVLRAKR